MPASDAERRRASIPAISYPAELPISQRRDDLIAAIAAHQVLIAKGETGSGKSTQLPKLCLQAGLGVEGWIGHTQPRRLAARTIAQRVADELGTGLGDLVGCTVRFHDEVSPRTLIKTMTDGILLAEIRRDPQLRRYGAIIIDEAHERTLNIDFLLGYLRGLIEARSDLRLIIASATIDTSRFAEHFGGAPVIEVGGRSHPVEVRYRPLDGSSGDDPFAAGQAGGGPDGSLDQVEGIERAVRELLAEGLGDVLVFCSGEREIRDTVDHLEDALLDVEVLALFARLSPTEQQRVFAAHTGRRVVVATNVAETSLTVVGIRSVVDAGTARISRFNRRTKVQRLPIEPISQASADQRAGRCGRLGPGVCIRLYSEDDYLSRPEFTEPEILRTNLAAVILQMAALDLGDPAGFGFIDPPQPSAVRDGIRLLEELGAVNPGQEGTQRWLTPVGARLAELPVDPRLARMLLAAEDHGCVSEMLIVVAGLAIQDPRIRPGVAQGASVRQAAESMHSRFDGDGSDFLAYLSIWRYVVRRRAELSGSAFRRMCRQEFLHYLRIREWQDLHGQLSRASKRLGLTIADDEARQHGAAHEAIHKAALSGLLSRVGAYDARRGDYRGPRSLRFSVASTGAIGAGRPEWLMAAEMVETERVLARVCAPISQAWLEEAGAHLLRWEYSAPWWDRSRGAAVCSERASLYGLGVVDDRTVLLHRIDPGLARHLLIRHALVEGDSDLDLGFVAHNRRSAQTVMSMQTRLRRDDLLIDDARLAGLYGAVVADSVVTQAHLEQWWHSRSDPRAACFSPAVLTDGTIDDDIDVTHPLLWRLDGFDLRIRYRFEPGAAEDGLTVEVPLDRLEGLDQSRFEWLVPGYRAPLIEALLRSLPKAARRSVGPAATAAAEIIESLDPDSGEPLAVQLAATLSRTTAAPVTAQMFDRSSLPSWLRPHFCVTEDGLPLAEDDDLGVLREWFARQATDLLLQASCDLERHGLKAFPDEDLPAVITRRSMGQTVRFYPGLTDRGDSVSVTLFTSPDEQAAATWAGTRRLLLLQRPAMGTVLRGLLSDRAKAAIVTSPYPSPAAWLDDCLAAAADAVMCEHDGPLNTSDSQLRLLSAFRSELNEVLSLVAEGSVAVLEHARQLQAALDAISRPAFAISVDDMREQLDRLVYDGFVGAVGIDRLDDLARYLSAARLRAARLADRAARDRDRTGVIRSLEAEHELLAQQQGWTAGIEDLAWQIQELRVSLFAQSVGVSGQVSVKRIRAGLERARSSADMPGS